MKQASVMIIEKYGFVLSISRKEDSSKYGLIGGKVEPGEDIKDAAIREVQEETGIIVDDCELVYEDGEGKTYYTYCFYAKSWNGNPRNSEEGNVEWLTKSDLTGDKGAFPKYNKKAFDALKEKFPEVKLI